DTRLSRSAGRAQTASLTDTAGDRARHDEQALEDRYWWARAAAAPIDSASKQARGALRLQGRTDSRIGCSACARATRRPVLPPGSGGAISSLRGVRKRLQDRFRGSRQPIDGCRSEEHTSELQSRENLVC